MLHILEILEAIVGQEEPGIRGIVDRRIRRLIVLHKM